MRTGPRRSEACKRGPELVCETCIEWLPKRMDASVRLPKVQRPIYSAQVAGKRTDAIEDRVSPLLEKLDATPSGPLRVSPEERFRMSRYLGALDAKVSPMFAPFIMAMSETFQGRRAGPRQRLR